MLPKLLFATEQGTVLEHPYLRAVVRSGDDLLLPEEKPIPLPAAGRLVHLPGRRPVGYDPETGKVEVVDRIEVEGKRIRPNAVGALLQPGYTRTFLPAEKREGGPVLSQWAYTAAGWGEDGPVVWAVHTDKRTHWEPSKYSTKELPKLVEARLKALPENKVLKQLKTCALLYRCFTSQNIFYVRDEGALPASIACNAKCVGCISEPQPDGPPSSHERMDDAPLGDELAELAIHHLKNAPGRTMVSFGQGCEGEPLTRFMSMVDAIEKTRKVTSRGSINLNTNASRTRALEKVIDAGLDAIRVSLNSAHPELYAAYYNPIGYTFADVEASIALARSRGLYIALNLLLFPGVTDRYGEVERLAELIVKHRIDQVQTRSLCIDPDQYLAVARGKGAGGEPMGVRNMLRALKEEAPWLVIGNFARGLDERGAAARSA